MADATIDLQATDIFNVNANFKIQSSTTSEPTTNPQNLDELGNVSCERTIEDITNYSQTMSYCGTDFVGDVLSVGGGFLTGFGYIWDNKLLTGVTINMTAGEYCSVDLEGHQHAVNSHTTPRVYADFGTALPADIGEAFENWDGFGVPDFGITVGNDASPASATVTLSLNHVDQMKEDGTHLVGAITTPRCELSMDFSGVPTSQTIAAIQSDLRANAGVWSGAYVDSIDSGDSNSDFDTFSFVAHNHTDLEAAV